MSVQPQEIASARGEALAQALDEVSDLCRIWSRHREGGRMPTALQGALLAAMSDALDAAKPPPDPIRLDWSGT